MTTPTTILTEARAPGKLILSGEHAVVYGQPALAMAVNIFARATLDHGSSRGLQISLPSLQLETNITPEELHALPDLIDAQYELYQDGRLPIAAVVRTPTDLLAYAFAITMREARLRDIPPLSVRVEADMPVGSGMGSSAAVGLAMLTVARAWMQLPIDHATLAAASLACERLQHGNPSGVDSHVCAYGGAVRYTHTAQHPVSLSPSGLLLIHTGRPQSTTGECVAAVRDRHLPRQIWDDFGEATRDVEMAMCDLDESALRRALRRNHALLNTIGVVPEPIAVFIDTIESLGGAAKISGAGSVAGKSAGVLLAMNSPETRRLARAHGYRIIDCKGDSHGTCLMPGHSPR